MRLKPARAEGAGSRVMPTWPTVLAVPTIDRVTALGAPVVRELLVRLLQAWVSHGQGGSEVRVDIVYLTPPIGQGAPADDAMEIAQQCKGAPAGWDAAWRWPLSLSPDEGEGAEAEAELQLLRCMGLELMAAVSVERGMDAATTMLARVEAAVHAAAGAPAASATAANSTGAAGSMAGTRSYCPPRHPPYFE